MPVILQICQVPGAHKISLVINDDFVLPGQEAADGLERDGNPRINAGVEMPGLACRFAAGPDGFCSFGFRSCRMGKEHRQSAGSGLDDFFGLLQGWKFERPVEAAESLFGEFAANPLLLNCSFACADQVEIRFVVGACPDPFMGGQGALRDAVQISDDVGVLELHHRSFGFDFGPVGVFRRCARGRTFSRNGRSLLSRGGRGFTGVFSGC